MKINNISVLLDKLLEMWQENAFATMHMYSEMPVTTTVLPLEHLRALYCCMVI